jgi:gliding motility-associated-like protein
VHFTSLRLTIFNRWGQRIFQSQSDQPSWDGTINGQQCPMGTYVYVLSFYDEGHLHKQTGAVELIR